jgi:predicted Zn-dependent protease
VVVGGIIGGLYVYNTDTVEVSALLSIVMLLLWCAVAKMVFQMTGRRRFNCVSHERELSMGAEGYQEVLREYRGHILPQSHPLSIMVDRVLQRLIPQARIDGADWKVHVIQDDNMTNAFVLPG